MFQGIYPMGDTQAFSKALSHFKEQSSELFGLIREEERDKLRRWEDEKPAISVSSRACVMDMSAWDGRTNYLQDRMACG